jgi:uncharacterized protein YbjT (DUF2867 family)
MLGVERVFSLMVGPELAFHERNIANVAKSSGVRQIVKLSVLGAGSNEIGGVAEWHGAGERAIQESGIAWTYLRPGAFMSNATFWGHWIRTEGRVYSNFGCGGLALIHPRDIALVATRALTESGHEGKTYSLTGGEALTTAEQVAVISRATNRAIQQVEVSDEEARRLMQASRMPQYLVDALVAFAPNVRAGRAGAILNTAKDLVGRNPLTFKDWVEENLSLFNCTSDHLLRSEKESVQ